MIPGIPKDMTAPEQDHPCPMCTFPLEIGDWQPLKDGYGSERDLTCAHCATTVHQVRPQTA